MAKATRSACKGEEAARHIGTSAQTALEQSKSMEKSVEEAKRAAAAMETIAQEIAVSSKAATASVSAIGQQMRAYICVVIGSAVYQERAKNLKFQAVPSVVNAGLTPAHKVSFRADAAILPIPLPENFTFPLPDIAQGTSVFGIVHKVFDHWTNCDVLTRADDGGPLRDIGKGEREIFWQRDWQYRRICSERNFMGGRKPGIDHGRDGLKFQVLRSLLIDRTTDDNADIRTHLLAYGRDASSSSLRANCNLLGNRFHGGGCSLGLFDGLLHRLGLLKGSLGTSTDMAGGLFPFTSRTGCFRHAAVPYLCVFACSLY